MSLPRARRPPILRPRRPALDVLEHFDARAAGISPNVFEYLESAAGEDQRTFRGLLAPGYSRNWARNVGAVDTRVTNLVIGNNATAVAAAKEEAERLGYAVFAESADHSEGPAEEVGHRLAQKARAMRAHAGPTCFISGGEPVVKLIDASRRGLGGRNQQLVLAALGQLVDDGAGGIVLLSGGTDGEDGPTDAAGAVLDADVLAAARQMGLDPADYLARNDAYHFFAPLAALIKTGPTHTNVCDLRVILVDRPS